MLYNFKFPKSIKEAENFRVKVPLFDPHFPPLEFPLVEYNKSDPWISITLGIT
jgi:hypothetical protein